MLKFLLIPALALSLTAPAFADDAAAAMAIPEKCFAADFYTKMLSKVAGLTPQQRDVVDSSMVMQIKMVDDAPFPHKFSYRTEDTDMPLPIQADGTVPDAAKLADMPAGEFCLTDKRIAENEDGKVGMGMDIDSDVLFKNTSGTHTLAELTEGLKDGKQHYKKMYGAMVSIIKVDHLMVEFEGDTPPDIKATKAGAPVEGLTTQDVFGTRLVALKDLKKLGADGLSISGQYTLSPVPNKKTLEKYFGD